MSTEYINPQILQNSQKFISNNLTNINPQKSTQINKKLSPSLSASNLIINNGFNPLTHIPPKYDLYGRLRPPEKSNEDIKLLLNKENIRIPWSEKNTNKSGAMTRTELIELRKKEKIPDISYDLDKDGYVGGRDLVIAKRYDIDKDGKLNEQEKKNAYEGLANNVEENYVWNVDNQGGKRSFRLLQKRGKIIDAEDFLPIRETYPVHPINKIIPHCATFTELKKLRKMENIKNIYDKVKLYEKSHPNKLIRNHSCDEIIEEKPENLHQPEFTSIEQIKKEKNRNDRIKCGLSPNTSDNRNYKNAPSLNYIYNPKYKTKNELDAAIKNEKFENAKKLINVKHLSDIERLNKREDEIFAKLYNEKEGLTYSKIKEKQRKLINEYNTKHFSNETLGVHGQELPKFSENNKEFWKLNDGYCENPHYKSQCEYLESIKYYKPPGEDLLLNEHRDEDPKWVDPFKKVHVLEAIRKKKEENFSNKIHNINIFKNFDPNNPKPIDYSVKPKHVYRWTTLVDKFSPNKFRNGRFFDSLPPAEEPKEENNIAEQLYLLKKSKHKDENEQNKNVISGNTQENVKLAKDSLFLRYSTREENKDILPKNSIVRSQGFE